MILYFVMIYNIYYNKQLINTTKQDLKGKM